MIDAPAPGFAMPHLLQARTIAVAHDGRGLLPLLAERLRPYGVKAIAADSEEAKDAGGVLCLAGLGPFEDEAAAMRANRASFSIAKAWAPRLAKAPGLFVVAQDTGGRFGASPGSTGGWCGGMTGLAKTARHEWPLASVKAIDLECGGRSTDQLAAALVSELCFGGDDVEVGLPADGARIKLACVATPAAQAAQASVLLDRNSVVVASGGARGVTAACVAALAHATRCRFVLLGKTALDDEPAALASCSTQAELNQALLDLASARDERPSLPAIRRHSQRILAQREIRSTLRALRLAGSEAIYCAVDITDRATLHACLAEVRRQLGPITGLIHGAGVLADSLIERKTHEQFDRVFDTKALGLASLLAGTASDPLRLVALFSSVVARSGNPGQADYAMANEVLNRVARDEARRRGPSCVVKSINWGAWAAGMMTPELRALFRKRGITLLSLDEGAERFVAEILAETSGETELILGDDPKKLAMAGAGADAKVVLDLAVGVKAYPCLLDHRIKGKVVVPAALAAEWFWRAGQKLLEAPVVTGLEIVKGVQLETADQPALAYRMICTPKGNAMFCELRDENDRVRYTASVTGGPAREFTAPPPAENGSAGFWQWSGRACYGDPLFHGPAYQVIDALGEIDSAGCSGWLKLGASAGVHILLDGGLQLVGLWAWQQLGLTVMPTAIGELLLSRHPLVDERVQCSVRIARSTASGLVTHLWFTGKDGSAIARMSEVRMYGIAASISKNSTTAGQPQ